MRLTRATRMVIAGVGLLAGTFSSYAASQGGKSVGKSRIGEFTISNPKGDMDFQFENDGTIHADLSGPDLAITSEQYDMMARRIQMTARRAGSNLPYKATRAVATGGTRIVVRQPEAQRTNTVTCSNASYIAAANPPALGRIDLKGNVRWVVLDPALAGPSVVTGESGFIDLLGSNSMHIKVYGGTAKATPREPAPRGKHR